MFIFSDDETEDIQFTEPRQLTSHSSGLPVRRLVINLPCGED
jgi:hypothetical protein